MTIESEGRDIKFTPEQIEAYEKLTKLQKGVALASLAGQSPSEAHKSAGGTCNNESQRKDLGGQILANPSVSAFMELMKTDPAEDIASAILSRDEILVDLSDISRTMLTDVVTFSERQLIDPENEEEVLTSAIHIKTIDEIPLGARKAIKSVKQTRYGLEVTMYDGLAARKQVSEMCGYNAPIKSEITGKDGQPIQTQEIPDAEIEHKLKTLGLGRYHNQLSNKIVTK